MSLIYEKENSLFHIDNAIQFHEYLRETPDNIKCCVVIGTADGETISVTIRLWHIEKVFYFDP